ncbi:hypothetical protein SASPL_135428 [Salvia splendens]|uniref:Uncharacterized protein n=1 Tax=Salvia splendens TaxID=180675 RepID=A0A8X8ZFP9_SALSN|nr:hypothetical protein SASPL_135428 [Salvia splendens]
MHLFVTYRTIGSVSGKLTGFGWNIFLVRGNFPKECPVASSEASNGFGQWLLPEDTERITKSCNTASRTQKGTEQQQQQLSDPYMKYDEDLKAAIADRILSGNDNFY